MASFGAMRGILFCLVACISCATPTDGVSSREEALIYGEIDFVDAYAHPDPALRQIARESVGGILDRRLISGGVPRTIRVGEAIEADFGVPYCEDEPFRDEPLLVNCSGALIDDDLFLTAAHCIPTQDFCDQFAIVFDWLYTSSGTLESIDPEDIYQCMEIVRISYLRDVAIVRLDRPVSSPHRPAYVRRGSEEVSVGDRMAVIGHPLGMPMKIEDTAEAGPIYAEGTESFLLRADTLAAHSGSPVLNRNGEIVGVVSRGPDQFVERSCIALATESGGEAQEVAGYVFRVMNDLCKKGPGSDRLCVDPNIWCDDCDSGCSATGRGSHTTWMLLALWFVVRRRRGRAPIH